MAGTMVYNSTRHREFHIHRVSPNAEKSVPVSSELYRVLGVCFTTISTAVRCTVHLPAIEIGPLLDKYDTSKYIFFAFKTGLRNAASF